MKNRFLKLYNDKKLIDNTDLIRECCHSCHNSFSNMHHAGGSVFIDMLEVFLSKDYDSREIFKNLKISEWKYFDKYINRYAVIKLDFSDFNANDYESAVEYFKEKMAIVFLKHNEYYILSNEECSPYKAKEWMNFIKKDFDESNLDYSLTELIHRIDLWYFKDEYKKALLIDNLVQVETVAMHHDYYNQMCDFLRKFIIEDIYHFVDLFLQAGHVKNEMDNFGFREKFFSYYGFTVWSKDIEDTSFNSRLIYDNNYYANENPQFITYIEALECYSDLIKEQEDLIAKAEIWYENWLAEQEKETQKHYQEELREDFPKISDKLGIRRLPYIPKTSKYHEINALLADIYSSNYERYDEIYSCFQQVDENKATDLIRHEDCYAQCFGELSGNWKIRTTVNSHWIQMEFNKKGSSELSIQSMIKVYISLDTAEINDIFIDIARYMAASAEKSFNIKASVCMRADTLCAWLSLGDLKVFEAACNPYQNLISKRLPFMPYKGNVAISRDLGRDMSYNYVMARIIKEYFKTIRNPEEIDVFAMYDMFVQKWNRSLPPHDNPFVSMSAFTLLIMAESIEAVLSEKDISDTSFLFYQDKDVLEALLDSKCWGEAASRYDYIKKRIC